MFSCSQNLLHSQPISLTDVPQLGLSYNSSRPVGFCRTHPLVRWYGVLSNMKISVFDRCAVHLCMLSDSSCLTANLEPLFQPECLNLIQAFGFTTASAETLSNVLRVDAL